MEFCMAVFNYDIVYIKGEFRVPRLMGGVSCGY
jgi:hypothetical protein